MQQFLDPKQAKNPVTRAIREVGVCVCTTVYNEKLRDGTRSIKVSRWTAREYNEFMQKLVDLGIEAELTVTHAGNYRVRVFNR